MLLSIVVLLNVLWPWAVTGTVMLYADSLPDELTSSCSDALLSDLACDPLVPNLRPDFFYPSDTLSRICTNNCSSALANWMSSVRTECGNQTVTADLGLEAAAVFIPAQLNYLLKFNCMQQNGNYCSPVAATVAAFDDPGVSVFNYLSDKPTGTRPSDCDICLVERLRARSGSPFFDGPAVAAEKQYRSLASSCRMLQRPISTTTVDYFTATPQPTQPTCDGFTYTIKSSDSCNSIAKSQGVGTAWLLSDNGLNNYCVGFPSSGDLCISHQCKTVTVGNNETCSGIAAANNITETQFHAWNPIVNMACSNLAAMNGTEVCVDPPGPKFVAPTSTLPPLTPTSAMPRPSDAADGSTKPCGQWYEVQSGDFCNAITLKFGISLTDLVFLNPGLNDNCTNLIAEESYCVQAVGDINTYSGRPGYMPITIDPSATFTGIPFTALPNATDTGYSRYTPVPTAPSTRDDCVHYFTGDEYQFDVNGTWWDSICVFVANMFEVDLDDFAAWNPGLGDVRSPDCAFQTGVRYCGSWYLQKPPGPDAIGDATPTTTTDSGTPSPTPPGPTQTGQPSDCNKWDVVEDGETCQTMADNAGISRAQFLQWNPTVNSDCSQNFWLGYAYCVGVSDQASTTTTSAPAGGPTKPPADYVQPGQPDNCSQWDRAVDGDYCESLADRNGLTVSQLADLNPALGQDGADCGTQMWLDYYYCVATS